MKAKDRRKLERQAEAVRRQQSCFPVDLKKLLAVDSFKTEILKAAEITKDKKGGEHELR